MAPIVSQAVLEEIRLNSDIATVVGSYFPLQRSGSAFKALCPFHKEKTPSFLVNPQRQIYHCFGCGAGGDAFRFVMEYEKVDFMSAVRILAKRAGIKLAFEDRGEGDRAAEKEVLYEINAQVARLYQQCLLRAQEADAARKYLQARDLPQTAIEEFMIGFVPERWDTVLQWAGKKYRPEQLEAAGLVIAAREQNAADDARRPDRPRWYDRFRNRLMFPIHDEQGRVAGFSGRTLEAEPQSAKYVNTPETVLFRKGRILYALHRARRAIVDAREAIVCEGQIDVIRCHLAGFGTAVAAQGTAFTEDHARMLRRYADSATLVFDADRAGQDAALRAAETFLQVGLIVKIASLPAGEDPDSLLRQPDGPAVFRKMLAEAKPALDFQIDVLDAREALGTEAGLMRATAAVLETIGRSPNAVQQARMLQRAAARLGVPEESLRRELQKPGRRVPAAPETAPVPAARPTPAREMALAEHLAADPKLGGLVRKYLPLDLITDDLCRRLIEACLESADTGGACPSSGGELMALVSARDNEARELAQFAARVLAAPLKVTGDLTTVEESVKSLILSLRAAALTRKKKALEKIRRETRTGVRPPLGAAEEKELEMQIVQLSYDIVRLKQWDTALPVLEVI